MASLYRVPVITLGLALVASAVAVLGSTFAPGEVWGWLLMAGQALLGVAGLTAVFITVGAVSRLRTVVVLVEARRPGRRS